MESQFGRLSQWGLFGIVSHAVVIPREVAIVVTLGVQQVRKVVTSKREKHQTVPDHAEMIRTGVAYALGL